MPQRYRRDMYPYQQPSIPFTQAVQQSQYYHPAFEQMMAQTLQQTQERHDNVVSAIAQDRTARSMMPHVDVEAHQRNLQSFTDDLESIAKDYNDHYGNAASRLIERIGKEASNPYYQLAAHHAKEYERERQAVAQFGPDALLPEGSVANRRITSDTTLADLSSRVEKASDYMGVGQSLIKGLAATVRDLGISEVLHPKFGSFIKTGRISELTPDMLRELVTRPEVIQAFKMGAPTSTYDYREGFSQLQTDEGISEFLYGLGAQAIHESVQYNYQNWTPPAPSGGDMSEGPTYTAQTLGANVENRIQKIDKDFGVITRLDDSIPSTERDKLNWREKELLSGSLLGVKWFGAEIDAAEYIYRVISDPATRVKFSAAFGPVLGNVLKAAVGRTDFTPKEAIKQQVVQAVESYKDNFYQNYPIVKDLQEAGVPVEQSLKIAQDHYRTISRQHLTSYSMRDSDIKSDAKEMILGNIILSDEPLWEYGKDKPERKTNLRDHLNNSKTSVTGLSVIPVSGDIILSTNTDGKSVDVKLPRTAFKQVTSNILDAGDSFFENLLQDRGLTSQITSAEDLIGRALEGELPVHRIGNRTVTFTKYFNSETKTIETDIFELVPQRDGQLAVRQIRGNDVSNIVLNYVYHTLTDRYKTPTRTIK